MTSDIGNSGSYAASKTHAEVRQDILESDCKGLSKTIRRDLIRPIVLFNFGDASRLPYLKLHFENRKTRRLKPAKYKTLSEIGLPIATEHLYEKFGIPKPAAGQETLQAPQQQSAGAVIENKGDHGRPLQRPPGLEASQRIVDQLADKLLVRSGPIIEKMLGSIRSTARAKRYVPKDRTP